MAIIIKVSKPPSPHLLLSSTIDLPKVVDPTDVNGMMVSMRFKGIIYRGHVSAVPDSDEPGGWYYQLKFNDGDAHDLDKDEMNEALLFSTLKQAKSTGEL